MKSFAGWLMECLCRARAGHGIGKSLSRAAQEIRGISVADTALAQKIRGVACACGGLRRKSGKLSSHVLFRRKKSVASRRGEHYGAEIPRHLRHESRISAKRPWHLGATAGSKSAG